MEKKPEQRNKNRNSCQSSCEESFLQCVESGRLDCMMAYKTCSKDCSI